MAQRYEGDLNKKGQPHGNGSARWPNGNSYTGTWCNGTAHGAGRFEFKSGDVYEGEVRWGKRSGRGVYTYADGGRYEGGFADDLEEGMGKRVWGSGDSYEGQWSRGEMDGRAVAVSANGDTYTGWFAASSREGKGRLDRADGSVYIGYWIDGHRQGKGTLFLRSGEGYHGAWAKDVPHGEGTWYFATPAKQCRSGTWEKGVLDGDFRPRTQPRPGSSAAIAAVSTGRAPATGAPLEPCSNMFSTDTHWWLEELWSDDSLGNDHWLAYPDPGTLSAEDQIRELASNSPFRPELAAGPPAADDADQIGNSPTLASGGHAAALFGSRRRLAQEVYLECCRQQSLAPSRGVVGVLPPKATTHDLRHLDVGQTYSGESGVLCLLQFLSQCPNLVELSLQRQGAGLTPKALVALCKLLETHPSLKCVDLSHNFIAHAEGKRLAQVCATTPRVEQIVLEGTKLNKGVVAQIAARCTANKKHNFVGRNG